MARAQLKQSLWEQKSVELSIRENIEIAWHSYDNSLVTMELFNSKLRKKTRELLDLTTEEYRQGKIDLLKFLEAQQIYLENHEKYLLAQHNYNLRLIELEQYMEFELLHD